MMASYDIDGEHNRRDRDEKKDRQLKLHKNTEFNPAQVKPT